MHPKLTKHWPASPGKEPLLKAIASGQADDVRELLQQYCDEMDKGLWLKRIVEPLLKKKPDMADYPDSAGYVLRSRGQVQLEEDDGDDDLSAADKPVSLLDHTAHVHQWTKAFVCALGLDEFIAEFENAAWMHDWGKADERFQALLLGGDRMAAGFSPKLWAKSGQLAMSKTERRRQARLSAIPDRFRHELLSLQLVESGKCAAFNADKDLVLHLIASHHGWARPFAPVVIDEEFTDVNLATAGVGLRWSKEERRTYGAAASARKRRGGSLLAADA